MNVLMYIKKIMLAFLLIFNSSFVFSKQEPMLIPSLEPNLVDDSQIEPDIGMPPMLKGMPENQNPSMAMPSMPPMYKKDSMPMPPKQAHVIPDNEADILQIVPQKCKPISGKFVWNFKDEELSVILQQMSDMLCINMVINEKIKLNMKLTIIGMTEMTKDEALTVMLSALSANGLALSQLTHNTWSLMSRPDAMAYPSKIITDPSNAAKNDSIATLFYKAKHASQETLKNVASAFISKEGKITNVGDQFIVIVDTGASLHRVGRIFEEIDVEDANNKIYIVPVNNADLKTVDAHLRKLFDVLPEGRPKTRGQDTGSKNSVTIDKIIADERTRSLLIVTDKESIKKIKDVIEVLDRNNISENTQNKIHLIRLKFADSESIAETLNKVVSSSTRRYMGRDSGTGLFEGEVKITSHKETNTLLIASTYNDYKYILSVIEGLDVSVKQVYIEAAILSLKTSAKSDFGINLFSGLQQNIPGIGTSLGIVANPGGGGIVSNVSTSLVGAAAGGAQNLGALAVLSNFLAGGVVGLTGPPIPGSNGIPSFGAVLQAMASNSNVDVLATPYLVTSDNKEAVFSSGEKIPVIKGVSVASGSAANSGLGIPTQNLSYEDVKLTFKVTPRIGDNDDVTLTIKQTVSDLGNKEQISTTVSQYRINEKDISTTIVLNNQQTGILGGLISQTESKNGTKIPFLGDIPLLGWLFKTRQNQTEKSNLFLVLTPYIIKTNEDYRKIIDAKTKARQEFADLYLGGKIKQFDPYIDYDKKQGPLVGLLKTIDQKMQEIENGGLGNGKDKLITPSRQIETIPFDDNKNLLQDLNPQVLQD